MTKNGWTLMDWDGNLELGLKCWRKRFGRGKISVGCGNFTTIVFSFGANSNDSFSGTRWRPDNKTLTEIQAMRLVDACKGNSDSFLKRDKSLDYIR